jgi:adenylate cyclase
LEALVASGVRDLDENEKLMLMAASLEGAEFDSRVVARATGLTPAECESRFSHLCDNHRFITFVGEDKTPAAEPSLRFRFAHSFYRDCLRRKLTPSGRKQVSGKVAEALEIEFPARAAQNPLELAELYLIAGTVDKERGYRVQAAMQQLSLGGYAAAIESSKRAEVLFSNGPESANMGDYRDVMVVMGVSLTALKGYANEDAHRAYGKAIEISDRAKLPAHFPSLYGVWMYTLVRGVMEDANELARGMLNLAMAEERLAVDRTQAWWAMGVTQYFIGKVSEARTNFEQGIQLYDASRHGYYASSYVLDPGVANRYLLARALWFLGYPDQASRMAEESLQLARRLKHVESLAFALVSAAIVHCVRGEVYKVQEYADELLNISEEDELRQHRPWARILHGWANGAEGDAAAGLRELREGLAKYEAMGAKLALSGFYSMEIDLCHRAGLFDEEAQVLDKAMQHLRDTGQRYYYPELLRLIERNRESRGMASDPQQSIANLEEARRAAVEMGSRSCEPRIITDLAAAMSITGENARAFEMLDTFLDGFTEGAETGDVKRAVDLREQLREAQARTN